MTIDHSTCGHVDHITFDASRHEELHTAIMEFIKRWYSEANRLKAAADSARSYDTACNLTTLADKVNSVINDLVAIAHPFEVEQ